MSSFRYPERTITATYDDCWEHHKGPLTIGVTVKYHWAGRGGCTDLGDILCGSHAGDPPVWVGDVGDDPRMVKNFGGGSTTAWPGTSWASYHNAKKKGFGIPYPLEDSLREAV